MRANWGSWSFRSVVALIGLAVAVPSVARAGGTRRAPTRAAVTAAVTAAETSSERASARIDGRVVDVDGKAVAGVTVLATRAHPDGRAHLRVESDRDGKFHFALPPGEYVFVALHRHLAGLTPAMQVLHALSVVLVVGDPPTAA